MYERRVDRLCQTAEKERWGKTSNNIRLHSFQAENRCGNMSPIRTWASGPIVTLGRPHTLVQKVAGRFRQPRETIVGTRLATWSL